MPPSGTLECWVLSASSSCLWCLHFASVPFTNNPGNTSGLRCAQQCLCSEQARWPSYTSYQALRALLLCWKTVQPSNCTMGSSQPTDTSFKYEQDFGVNRMLDDFHSKLGGSSRLSVHDLRDQQLRKSDMIDSDLLSSQQSFVQDACARVQPTDNPYHWEAPLQDRKSIVLTWVRAPWTHTSVIVRQRVGTLHRRAAVRRHRNSGSHSRPVGASICAPRPEHGAVELTTHRSFSFEILKQREDISSTMEETNEEDVTSDITTWKGSKVSSPGPERMRHLCEEVDELPRIARTFSEISGGQHFVPTALMEAD